jgi:hypothetical protein
MRRTRAPGRSLIARRAPLVNESMGPRAAEMTAPAPPASDDATPPINERSASSSPAFGVAASDAIASDGVGGGCDWSEFTQRGYGVPCKLSHAPVNLGRAMQPTNQPEVEMSQARCPWCECELPLSELLADDAECPSCLTSWSYEDEPVADQAQLPLAA